MTAGNLGIFVAFAAGLASFVSPCILPVIPSYLSFIGGTSDRGIVFVRTLFFVAGFSAVFTALGAFFSGAGAMLAGAQIVVNRVAGAVVVLFGLNIIFDFLKILNFELRFHPAGRPRGVLGSFLIGLAFGAGWTPCVGPILSSILLLAGSTGTMANGIALLAVYSIGLGLPFLIAGAFFDFFSKQAARLRAHMQAVKTASGIIVILLGVMIFFGSLSRLNGLFYDFASALELWQSSSPWGPRILFGSLFLAAAALVAWKMLRDGEKPARAFVRPGYFAFFLAFLTLAALILTGVLDIPALLGAWLRFQGI